MKWQQMKWTLLLGITLLVSTGCSTAQPEAGRPAPQSLPEKEAVTDMVPVVADGEVKMVAPISVQVNPNDLEQAERDVVDALLLADELEMADGIEVRVYDNGDRYLGSLSAKPGTVHAYVVDRTLSASAFQQDVQVVPAQTNSQETPLLLQLFPGARGGTD